MLGVKSEKKLISLINLKWSLNLSMYRLAVFFNANNNHLKGRKKLSFQCNINAFLGSPFFAIKQLITVKIVENISDDEKRWGRRKKKSFSSLLLLSPFDSGNFLETLFFSFCALLPDNWYYFKCCDWSFFSLLSLQLFRCLFFTYMKSGKIRKR